MPEFQMTLIFLIYIYFTKFVSDFFQIHKITLLKMNCSSLILKTLFSEKELT